MLIIRTRLVALMREGVLVWAAEEERYSRIKHTLGFPVLALRAGLEEHRRKNVIKS